jgi:AAA15 family ATPase/GTPase
MLEHIHIKNFRLFQELDIPKVGQVNLITGKNNTGKTTLLEALRLWGSQSLLIKLNQLSMRTK